MSSGFGADLTAHTLTRARVAVGIDKRAFSLESIWTYCRYVQIGPNGVRGDYFSGQPLSIDLSGCARTTVLSARHDSPERIKEMVNLRRGSALYAFK
jgi:hypothetical protein